jgi:hypothetical protein
MEVSAYPQHARNESTSNRARGPKPMLTTNGGDCERTPEVEMILNKESKVADRALLLSGAG